jgi:hypothetical protein
MAHGVNNLKIEISAIRNVSLKLTLDRMLLRKTVTHEILNAFSF